MRATGAARCQGAFNVSLLMRRLTTYNQDVPNASGITSDITIPAGYFAALPHVVGAGSSSFWRIVCPKGPMMEPEKRIKDRAHHDHENFGVSLFPDLGWRLFLPACVQRLIPKSMGGYI
jgi:hypothetical protein